jgi:hypothetical protein
VTTLGNQYGI